MEFYLIDFIEHILNVLVLFLLLRVFLYRPVSAFMAEREAKYAGERAAIDAGRAEAEALRAQYEAALAGASRAAGDLAAQRVKEAEHEAQGIREKAQADAQSALALARAQAEAERQETLGALREQTAALAVDLAGRILAREITAEDNRKLIDGFFEKVS